MRINTNVSSLNSQRILGQTAAASEKAMGRLSSGFRINSAKDDAAGLAIANKLRGNVRSLQQASRNASQATAMLQVVDGAAQTVGSILDRMKELATQANSANIGTETSKLQAEFSALRSEIGRIASTTKYQGTALVDGNFGVKVNSTSAVLTNSATTNVTGVSITGPVDTAGTYALTEAGGDVTLTYTSAGGDVSAQTIDSGNYTAGDTLNFDKLGIAVTTDSDFATGNIAGNGAITFTGSGGSFMVSSSGAAAYGSDDRIAVSAVNLATNAAGLGLDALDLNSQANAVTALTALDTAIGKVNTALGDVGASMNRIDYAKQNTDVLIQNTQAAESTIRDADMAEEMSTFSKTQILQQAGIAMLAQANQAPQMVLKLLG